MSAEQLALALRALRLNLHFPPWRDLATGLRALAQLPPGQSRLRYCPDTGWPHPEEWLRARVDRRLAPELLPRLQAHADAGDAPAAQKLRYFQALLHHPPLEPAPLRVGLIRSQGGEAWFELTLDRLELSLPGFVRWTLRLGESSGERLQIGELESRASERFTHTLRALTTQSAAQAMVALQAMPDIQVEEIVRGEVGPARPGPHGPWLSASLSRASQALPRVSIDDPLHPELLLPDSAFGLSSHRKWAVPHRDLPAARAWLAEQGSRNLVYPYRSGR